MSFLQYEGFTLGVRDILTVKKADSKRKKLIKEGRKVGIKAVTAVLDLPVDTDIDIILENIEKTSATNPKFRTNLDRQYKTITDNYTNSINK